MAVSSVRVVSHIPPGGHSDRVEEILGEIGDTEVAGLRVTLASEGGGETGRLVFGLDELAVGGSYGFESGEGLLTRVSDSELQVSVASEVVRLRLVASAGRKERKESRIDLALSASDPFSVSASSEGGKSCADIESVLEVASGGKLEDGIPFVHADDPAKGRILFSLADLPLNTCLVSENGGVELERISDSLYVLNNSVMNIQGGTG